MFQLSTLGTLALALGILGVGAQLAFEMLGLGIVGAQFPGLWLVLQLASAPSASLKKRPQKFVGSHLSGADPDVVGGLQLVVEDPPAVAEGQDHQPGIETGPGVVGAGVGLGPPPQSFSEASC